MIAVVSGASGFIGSHVVDLLLEKGYQVRCLVRPSSNLRWLQDKPVEFRELQLSDQEQLNDACRGASYIIHCAGSIAARSEEEFIRDNKGVTEHMLRAALTTASTLKRFVHVSSMSACGPAKDREHPLDGSSHCAPITAYGRSKFEAEKVVLSAKDRLPVTIIRPPAVYGDRDEATFSFFQMVHAHIAPLIGLSEKWISMVHVSDLARGIVQAMESENSRSKIYFIATEKFYTWTYIAGVIAEIMKTRMFRLKIPHFLVLLVGIVSGFISRFSSKPAVFNYEKGIDFIQSYWICSIAEAQRDFNYEPKVELHEGMEKTILWYREQRWL